VVLFNVEYRMAWRGALLQPVGNRLQRSAGARPGSGSRRSGHGCLSAPHELANWAASSETPRRGASPTEPRPAIGSSRSGHWRAPTDPRRPARDGLIPSSVDR
jgi:hypothetical protein